MANDVSASFPEYWSRRMQRKHYKTDRYREIVSMEEQETLKRGDIVHRPYRSGLVVNDLGSDGSYTRQDITDTDESLSIDQEKEVSFYIREIDEIQSNYKTRNEYADDAAVKLGNQIDGQVFGEYDQATSIVDDGDLGGTDGDGFEATTSNLDKIFGEANEKLDSQNIDEDGRWAMISPQLYNILWQRIGGRESLLGDKSGQRGHMGAWAGFKVFKSNALGWSGRLEWGTNPTDGDTVVINGVTFTFKDTLGSTAGNVHICSTAAKTLDQFVSAINTPGTTVAEATDAGFVALSQANQDALKNITATDGTTFMTLKATGFGYVVVSETLTAAADVWTEADQIQHNIFGQGKPIDLVIQKRPNMIVKDRTGYIGSDIVSWTVFGLNTFDEGTDQLVDVQIKSANF